MNDIAEKEPGNVKGGRHFLAIATAVSAALITLIGGVVTTYLNNSAQLHLEAKEFEATLILEAVKSKDRDSASDMLLFLVESGLIEDREDKLRNLAKNKKIPFSGRGGVPYKEEFIREVFAKFNNNTELTEVRRAILIELADNYVNRRWNRVATFFEPAYFYEQLTFLSGDREIIDVFVQYIQEALVKIDGENYTFNIWDRKNGIVLNNIEKMYFLDILPGTGQYKKEIVIVKFELEFIDKSRVIVGYEFLSNEFYIVGAMG